MSFSTKRSKSMKNMSVIFTSTTSLILSWKILEGENGQEHVGPGGPVDEKNGLRRTGWI